MTHYFTFFLSRFVEFAAQIQKYESTFYFLEQVSTKSADLSSNLGESRTSLMSKSGTFLRCEHDSDIKEQ